MKTLPWLISMAVHGLVLLIGGLAIQQAIVGVAPGRNSIEINLVAKPSESTPDPALPPSSLPEEPIAPAIQPPLPPVAEVTPPPVPIDPVPIPETVPVTAIVPPVTSPSKPPKQSNEAPQLQKQHSSNFAHNTGKDTLTAQSMAGAIVDEEPDYLSNPAPIYPQAARDQEQEGLVILDVIVSTDGCSETIKVSSGSGYHLLDEAAREAVQHYRFRPAFLNGIKVRSHVQVPIRFRLDG